MKLLVAKRNGMSDGELRQLEQLGFELVADAVDTAPYGGDSSGIEAVICYQFFNHNDIRSFPNLKLIHLTSAGYDHMPLDYLREKGIALYNNRGTYSVPIAEYVLGGVLQLYKEAAYFRTQAEKRSWRQLGKLRELGGKTVTILGAGSIAAEISRRFTAMGCTVTALCRHPKDDPDFHAQKNVAELDSILPHTDILILAAPLNEGTYHIMDSRRFGLMKKDSVFVNIGRGALADTAALTEGSKLTVKIHSVVTVCTYHELTLAAVRGEFRVKFSVFIGLTRIIYPDPSRIFKYHNSTVKLFC